METFEHHREIENLLQSLCVRELTREEWSLLDSFAEHDLFLQDALRGLRQIPAEERIARISSILKNLSSGRKRRQIGIPVWTRVAASLILVIGVIWLVRQVSVKEKEQFAETTSVSTNEESVDSAPESMQEQSLITHADDGGRQITSPGNNDQSSRAWKQTPGTAESAQPKPEGSSAKSERSQVDMPATVESSKESDSQMRPQSGTMQTASDDRTVLFETQEPRFVQMEPEVKGVVMNDIGERLSGVQIVLKGTSVQTQTDVLGNFALDVPARSEPNALVISFEGYPSLETKVSDGDSIIVRLQNYARENGPAITTLSQKRMADAGGPTTRSLARPVSGDRSYQKYIRQNLRYPAAASQAGMHGKVIVEFDIDANGNPSNFRIVQSLGYGCDEEAIRLIREGPKWNIKDAQVPIGRLEIDF